MPLSYVWGCSCGTAVHGDEEDVDTTTGTCASCGATWSLDTTQGQLQLVGAPPPGEPLTLDPEELRAWMEQDGKA